MYPCVGYMSLERHVSSLRSHRPRCLEPLSLTNALFAQRPAMVRRAGRFQGHTAPVAPCACTAAPGLSHCPSTALRGQATALLALPLHCPSWPRYTALRCCPRVSPPRRYRGPHRNQRDDGTPCDPPASHLFEPAGTTRRPAQSTSPPPASTSRRYVTNQPQVLHTSAGKCTDKTCLMSAEAHRLGLPTRQLPGVQL